MNKKRTVNWLKIMTIAASGLSILATVVSDWVSGKEMEALVEDKIKEILSNEKKGEK